MRRTAMRRTVMSRAAMLRAVGVMMTGCLAWGTAARLEAQTDWSSFPVAPGQSYVISSSPTADGGTITTTYVPPRNVAVASTLPGVVGNAPASPAYAQRPMTSQGYPVGRDVIAAPRGYETRTIQPTSYQVPAPGSVPSGTLTPGNVVSGPPAAAPGSATMTTGVPPTAAAVNPYVGFPVRTVPNSGIATAGYYGTPTNCGMPGATPANLPPTLGTYPGSTLGSYPGMVPIKGTYRPLVPIGKIYPQTYVAQGLIGQPKAFVDGQPVRNFFRYVLP